LAATKANLAGTRAYARAVSRELAVALNQRVWSLLENERSPEDDEVMTNAAHASLHHWGEVGGPLEAARGEWLVAHVYAVRGRAEPALHHARRCLALTETHGFGGFDRAYAYEGMARALAASGDKAEGKEAAAWRARAAEAVAAIEDDEDRRIFEADLTTSSPGWD
jgi:hypothetical protein